VILKNNKIPLYELVKPLMEPIIPCSIGAYCIDNSTSYKDGYEHIAFWNELFTIDKPSLVIRRLSEFGILKYVLPDLENARNHVQNKSKSDNLFTHTLQVIDLVFGVDIRWAALFHDLGKMYTLLNRKHAIRSEEVYKRYIYVCTKDKYRIDNLNIICDLIKFHMLPYSFYQWTYEYAINFIKMGHCKKIVQLAIADKASSNPQYVGMFDDLFEICDYSNFQDRLNALNSFYKRIGK